LHPIDVRKNASTPAGIWLCVPTSGRASTCLW
jgi:hypothetical protein